MPLYDMTCKCGYLEERLLAMGQTDDVPCPRCGTIMTIRYAAPPMVKMKGEGGYPSRKRQVFNTTKRDHPPLEKEKNRVTF